MLAPARSAAAGATMREAVVTLAHERGLAMVVEGDAWRASSPRATSRGWRSGSRISWPLVAK